MLGVHVSEKRLATLSSLIVSLSVAVVLSLTGVYLMHLLLNRFAATRLQT